MSTCARIKIIAYTEYVDTKEVLVIESRSTAHTYSLLYIRIQSQILICVEKSILSTKLTPSQKGCFKTKF